MNSKTCKQIRRQSKKILVDWFKTLVSDQQSKEVDTSNILSYLSPQTHIFANNQLRLNAYSFKWTVKAIKKIVKKNNMDVNTVRLQDVEKEKNS